MVCHFPYTTPPSQCVQTGTAGHTVEKSGPKCLTEVNGFLTNCKTANNFSLYLNSTLSHSRLEHFQTNKKIKIKKFVI